MKIFLLSPSKTFRRLVASLTLCAFVTTTALPSLAQSVFTLPAPGVRINLSPPYNPVVLRGVKVNPDNPFQFEFIVDGGDSGLNSQTTDRSSIKAESEKLIKYFLASLTTPENDMWVNLSPYEKDRIVPDSFGATEMGRDLLAEDYLLKQISASILYPEEELGKKFWQRVYEEAWDRFHTTEVPIDTFNKVWVVPDKAVVYEHATTAFVTETHLKVMLEEDYVALSNQKDSAESPAPSGDVALSNQKDSAESPAPSGDVTLSHQTNNVESPAPNTRQTDVNGLGAQILRAIIIPELEREVNEGKNFARLRQVYHSLILATWYKRKLKDSILAKIYVDQKKTQGVDYRSSVIAGNPQGATQSPDHTSSSSGNDIEAIYAQYLKAFQQGVYNYIKEDYDPATQETIPRKYVSGGIPLMKVDRAMLVTEDKNALQNFLNKGVQLLSLSVALNGLGDNALAQKFNEQQNMVTKTAHASAEANRLRQDFEHLLQKNDEQALQTFLSDSFAKGATQAKILKLNPLARSYGYLILADQDDLDVYRISDQKPGRANILPVHTGQSFKSNIRWYTVDEKTVAFMLATGNGQADVHLLPFSKEMTDGVMSAFTDYTASDRSPARITEFLNVAEEMLTSYTRSFQRITFQDRLSLINETTKEMRGFAVRSLLRDRLNEALMPDGYLVGMAPLKLLKIVEKKGDTFYVVQADISDNAGSVVGETTARSAMTVDRSLTEKLGKEIVSQMDNLQNSPSGITLSQGADEEVLGGNVKNYLLKEGFSHLTETQIVELIDGLAQEHEKDHRGRVRPLSLRVMKGKLDSIHNYYKFYDWAADHSFEEELRARLSEMVHIPENPRLRPLYNPFVSMWLMLQQQSSTEIFLPFMAIVAGDEDYWNWLSQWDVLNSRPRGKGAEELIVQTERGAVRRQLFGLRAQDASQILHALARQLADPTRSNEEKQKMFSDRVKKAYDILQRSWEKAEKLKAEEFQNTLTPTPEPAQNNTSNPDAAMLGAENGQRNLETVLKASSLGEDVGKIARFYERLGMKSGDYVVSVGDLANIALHMAALRTGIHYQSFELRSSYTKSTNDALQSFDLTPYSGSAKAIAGEFSWASDQSKVIADHSQDFVLMLTGAVSDPSPESDSRQVLEEALRVVQNGGKIILGTVGSAVIERGRAQQVIDQVLASSPWKGNVQLKEEEHLKGEAYELSPSVYAAYKVEFTDAAMLAATNSGDKLEKRLSFLSDDKNLSDRISEAVKTDLNASGHKFDRAMLGHTETSNQPQVFSSIQEFIDEYSFIPYHVDMEMPVALHAIKYLLNVRRSQKGPIVVWQNLSLGEMYPFFSEDLKKAMNVVEIDNEDALIQWSADPARIPADVRRADFIIVKLKKPSSPSYLDRTLQNGRLPEDVLYDVAAGMKGQVVMIDSSKRDLSRAQEEVKKKYGGWMFFNPTMEVPGHTISTFDVQDFFLRSGQGEQIQVEIGGERKNAAKAARDIFGAEIVNAVKQSPDPEFKRLSGQLPPDAAMLADVFDSVREGAGQRVFDGISLYDPYEEGAVYHPANLDEGPIPSVKSVYDYGFNASLKKRVLGPAGGFGIVMLDSKVHPEAVLVWHGYAGCCGIAIRARNKKTGKIDIGLTHFFPQDESHNKLLETLTKTQRELAEDGYEVLNLIVSYEDDAYKSDMGERTVQEYNESIKAAFQQEHPDITVAIQSRARADNDEEDIAVSHENVMIRKKKSVRSLDWQGESVSLTDLSADRAMLSMEEMSGARVFFDGGQQMRFQSWRTPLPSQNSRIEFWSSENIEATLSRNPYWNQGTGLDPARRTQLLKTVRDIQDAMRSSLTLESIAKDFIYGLTRNIKAVYLRHGVATRGTLTDSDDIDLLVVVDGGRGGYVDVRTDHFINVGGKERNVHIGFITDQMLANATDQDVLSNKIDLMFAVPIYGQDLMQGAHISPHNLIVDADQMIGFAIGFAQQAQKPGDNFDLKRRGALERARLDLKNLGQPHQLDEGLNELEKSFPLSSEQRERLVRRIKPEIIRLAVQGGVPAYVVPEPSEELVALAGNLKPIVFPEGFIVDYIVKDSTLLKTGDEQNLFEAQERIFNDMLAQTRRREPIDWYQEITMGTRRIELVIDSLGTWGHHYDEAIEIASHIGRQKGGREFLEYALKTRGGGSNEQRRLDILHDIQNILFPSDSVAMDERRLISDVNAQAQVAYQLVSDYLRGTAEPLAAEQIPYSSGWCEKTVRNLQDKLKPLSYNVHQAHSFLANTPGMKVTHHDFLIIEDESTGTFWLVDPTWQQFLEPSEHDPSRPVMIAKIETPQEPYSVSMIAEAFAGTPVTDEQYVIWDQGIREVLSRHYLQREHRAKFQRIVRGFENSGRADKRDAAMLAEKDGGLRQATENDKDEYLRQVSRGEMARRGYRFQLRPRQQQAWLDYYKNEWPKIVEKDAEFQDFSPEQVFSKIFLDAIIEDERETIQKARTPDEREVERIRQALGIMEAQLRRWGVNADLLSTRVMMIDGFDSDTAESVTSGLYLYFNNMLILHTGLSEESLYEVILHEMYHRLSLGLADVWFDEGITEYLTIKTMIDAGLIPPQAEILGGVDNEKLQQLIGYQSVGPVSRYVLGKALDHSYRLHPEIKNATFTEKISYPLYVIMTEYIVEKILPQLDVSFEQFVKAYRDGRPYGVFSEDEWSGGFKEMMEIVKDKDFMEVWAIMLEKTMAGFDMLAESETTLAKARRLMDEAFAYINAVTGVFGKYQDLTNKASGSATGANAAVIQAEISRLEKARDEELSKLESLHKARTANLQAADIIDVTASVEPYPESGSESDRAMLGVKDKQVGGIDFNPNKVKLDVRRDGEAIEFHFDPKEFENMNVDGFTPVIIDIKPLESVPLFLGLNDASASSTELTKL